MFIIDVSLKSAPVTLTVQRKTEDDANGLYHTLIESMRSGQSGLVELTCEHQAGKKVTVLASEIAAVQVYEKSSTATSSGRPPGFFALAE